MKHIVIIGAGELGGCIGTLLKSKASLVVEWWDSDPSKVPNQKPLSMVMPRADFLFLCVPSWVFRNALTNVKLHLKKSTIIVSFAKGIEQSTHKTMDMLLSEVLGRAQPIALMSGPMLAEELEKGFPAGALLASRRRDVYERVARVFSGTPLTVCHSFDVRGVAISGALKNVYAMALGMSDGLELGMNTRGLLLVRAVEEMASILSLTGGRAATAYSLAGIGDLIATGSSEYSKNYSVGKAFAQSGICSIESEGKASLVALESIIGSYAKKLRLFQTVKMVISCKKNARTAFAQYFKSCE